MLTPERFQVGMAKLAATFTTRELTPATMAIYWDALKDLDDDAYIGAVERIILSEQWFPVPAMVRKYAVPFIDPQVAGAAAFEKVCNLSIYTPTGPVWKLGQIIEELGPIAGEAFVAAGATSAFASQQTDQGLPFLRKAFVEAYGRGLEAQAKGLHPTLPPAGTPVAKLPPNHPFRQLTKNIGRPMLSGPMRPTGTED